MPRLPRGTCRICGQDVALRRNGKVRQHRLEDGVRKCPGSGFLAIEVKPISEAEG